jgi:hypothetical protein
MVVLVFSLPARDKRGGGVNGDSMEGNLWSSGRGIAYSESAVPGREAHHASRITQHHPQGADQYVRRVQHHHPTTHSSFMSNSTLVPALAPQTDLGHCKHPPGVIPPVKRAVSTPDEINVVPPWKNVKETQGGRSLDATETMAYQ